LLSQYEKGTLRQNNQSDFKAQLFKVTIMKLQENEVNFATFVPKTLLYIIIECDNRYNKMLIEVNGVQFWSQMPILCREFVWRVMINTTNSQLNLFKKRIGTKN